MADSEVTDDKRFCREFFHHNKCSIGPTCRYYHRHPHEIESVSIIRGKDYVLGKIIELKNQRPCRFYQLGKCAYEERCRFSHDIDNNLRNNNESIRNSQLAHAQSGSAPSTSTIHKTGCLPKVPKAKPHDNSGEGACCSASLMDGKVTLRQRETCNSANGYSNEDYAESSNEEGSSASPPVVLVNNKNWVDAPEFVPRKSKSYAEVVNPETFSDVNANANRRLCPYASRDGICLNLEQCNNLHGEYCDMCERFVLHPYDEEERKKHHQECIKTHEKNMELSFAIQRSKDKTCGVCFEVIMEKTDSEQRFGILPSCNHCFCLACIRKWRQARQFENKIIRACPECRVTSDFICPSTYWVDTKEEKDKLIEDYKQAMATKFCKYFRRGMGKCPFGNKCFYMHLDTEGRAVDVGPPIRQRRNRNVDSDVDVLQVMLWDFLDERDFPWVSLAEDLEDLVSFFTESDESDWSDYELFLD